jgi:hypothetical protein
MNRSKRTKVTEKNINESIKIIINKIHRKIAKNGGHTYESTHEIYGIIAEEYHELILELHSNRTEDFIFELEDLAVAAIWGIASMKTLKEEGVYK